MTVGNRESKLTKKDRLAIAVDVWKYVVSVQMHFNEMEMKVRNLYFTVLAASLGLIGVVQGKQLSIISNELYVPIFLFVFIAIIPISTLFYFIDRHWYHRLLQGSVNQAIEIEKRYSIDLPEIQLGEAYPVDSGSAICSVLNDRNRAVARTYAGGQRSLTFPISDGVF